ncbi:NAD-dependent epimerase [Brachybacterium endophyticum]|uniref:NAD-dependent epimerase n=1 Tax=Brachybacterium endophyticum TaxID=2182385 RepID=A0A2U2RJ62_9MICO|nr:NAD(P)-dependent oxidoreductase [Brachybacterium endophyticum]PWH05896.1 NAD-dependent epimerase [Brachybacterium endophyticum]
MSDDAKRRILLTGATGGVGTALLERLDEEYEILPHGRHTDDPALRERLLTADISDYEQVLALMDGVDTVVHLAGSASPESEWEAVLEANIVGQRNVLEAAHRAGVRRVVLASSNHAMGGYDRHEQWPVYASQVPWPDSLYGVSKVFGEALGRYYHDHTGLEVIALRIGWMSEDPLSTDVDLLRAMWLSPDDAARAVRSAIEAEVTFGLYYAISANPNRRWDITDTMLDLGYRPQDSWTDRPGASEEVVEGGADSPEDWPEGS